MAGDKRSSPWRVLVPLLVVGGLFAFLYGMVWHEWGVKNIVFPKNFDVVEEGAIYRSGQIHRMLIEDLLEDHGIDVIIDLASDPDDENEKAEIEAAKAAGVRHETFPLTGHGTGDIEMYAQALRTLHEAREEGKQVLLHCHGGSERTGGAIAFYRVYVQGWAPDDAVREMLEHSHRPKKNPRLLPYMNAHAVELADRLKALGVIEKTPQRVPYFRVPRDK